MTLTTKLLRQQLSHGVHPSLNKHDIRELIIDAIDDADDAPESSLELIRYLVKRVSTYDKTQCNEGYGDFFIYFLRMTRLLDPSSDATKSSSYYYGSELPPDLLAQREQIIIQMIQILIDAGFVVGANVFSLCFDFAKRPTILDYLLSQKTDLKLEDGYQQVEKKIYWQHNNKDDYLSCLDSHK
jgi:hypothetical protein